MEALKISNISIQKPPPHLHSAGRSLWQSTLKEWSLTDADLTVLQTASEAVDRLVEIREAIDADGVVIVDPSGRQRAHPLLAVEQSIRGILLRAWSQLKLTDEEPPKIGRPSTRV
jgi:P27 family predicted phage terminase small subunit